MRPPWLAPLPLLPCPLRSGQDAVIERPRSDKWPWNPADKDQDRLARYDDEKLFAAARHDKAAELLDRRTIYGNRLKEAYRELWRAAPIERFKLDVIDTPATIVHGPSVVEFTTHRRPRTP